MKSTTPCIVQNVMECLQHFIQSRGIKLPRIPAPRLASGLVRSWLHGASTKGLQELLVNLEVAGELDLEEIGVPV
jgi:hypothetical protein